VYIGQSLLGFVGSYYSPWFPRQGNAAMFAAECIAHGNSGSLQFAVQTKNKEEVDASATVLGSSAWMDTGVIATYSATGLLELVRFAYKVGPHETGWVHFRMLPPAWQMNGA
jgi:hypothetical protein